MKNNRMLRMLVVALPLLSLLASGSVVAVEYRWRDNLAHELAEAEKEYKELIKQLPPSSAPHHDDKDHHDEKDHHD